MRIVIDTNVVLSALIRNSMTRRIIVSLSSSFYYPEPSFDEILRNKGEVMEKGRISQVEFNKTLAILFKYITLVKLEEMEPHLKKADGIIGNVHKNDVPFIAAALAKSAAVWSNDRHFQKQNQIPVLTTRDIISSDFYD